MDNLKPWTLVKYGFWLGIGFIIPSVLVTVLGSVGAFIAMPVALDEDSASFSDDFDLDKSGQIEITGFREVRTDDQMYIVGAVRNAGEEPVGSIQLEAELYDTGGTFIYECSEYINQRIPGGGSENFRISCGCRGQQLPEYTDIKVKVTQAFDF